MRAEAAFAEPDVLCLKAFANNGSGQIGGRRVGILWSCAALERVDDSRGWWIVREPCKNT